MSCRDESLLLAAQKAGAEGRFLTFLTRENGLARLYYRRFRRRQRVEFLDVLQQGELIYTPAGEFAPGRLQSFHCRRVWPCIRGDLERLICALQAAETALLLSSEGEPGPEMYELLVAVFDHLDQGGDAETLRILFMLRALRAAGFSPSVEKCFICREDPGRSAYFSSQGGAVCVECRKERGIPSNPVSAGALSVMRRSLVLPLAGMDRLKVGKRLGDEILPLLQDALEAALDARPRSTLFSRRLDKALQRATGSAL